MPRKSVLFLLLSTIFQTIMKTRLIFLLSHFVTFITCLQQTSQIITHENTDSVGKSAEFDLFIFTQHWPYTTCYDWMSHRRGNKCTKSIGKFVSFNERSYHYTRFSIRIYFQTNPGAFMGCGRPSSTRSPRYSATIPGTTTTT